MCGADCVADKDKGACGAEAACTSEAACTLWAAGAGLAGAGAGLAAIAAGSHKPSSTPKEKHFFIVNSLVG